MDLGAYRQSKAERARSSDLLRLVPAHAVMARRRRADGIFRHCSPSKVPGLLRSTYSAPLRVRSSFRGFVVDVTA